jgi:hypothetical protein
MNLKATLASNKKKEAFVQMVKDAIGGQFSNYLCEIPNNNSFVKYKTNNGDRINSVTVTYPDQLSVKIAGKAEVTKSFQSNSQWKLQYLLSDLTDPKPA